MTNRGHRSQMRLSWTMKPGSQVRYKVKSRHRRGTVKAMSAYGRYARVLKSTKQYLMMVTSL